MDVIEFEVSGPLLLTPRKFCDERGFVSEIYNARRLEPLIGPVLFVQENHSLSTARGTVRGLHFQIPPAAQGKLVRAARGSVYDVAVDIRSHSPTFGRYIGVELTAENCAQFWIPSGFAHGFCTLESNTEIIYKLTEYFNPPQERGIAWDDPRIGITWPVSPEKAVLSERDRHQGGLGEMPAYFRLS